MVLSGTSARNSAVKGSAVTVTVDAPPDTVTVLPNSAAPVRTTFEALVGLCTGWTRGAGGALVSFSAQAANSRKATALVVSEMGRTGSPVVGRFEVGGVVSATQPANGAGPHHGLHGHARKCHTGA